MTIYNAIYETRKGIAKLLVLIIESHNPLIKEKSEHIYNHKGLFIIASNKSTIEFWIINILSGVYHSIFPTKEILRNPCLQINGMHTLNYAYQYCHTSLFSRQNPRLYDIK